MAMGNDKIKDLFSSKLNGFEANVPPMLWGGIDQLLSQVPLPVVDPSSSASSASTTTSTSSTSASASSAVGVKAAVIAVGVAAAIATGVIVMRDKSEVQQPIVEQDHVIVQDPIDSTPIVDDSVFVVDIQRYVPPVEQVPVEVNQPIVESDPVFEFPAQPDTVVKAETPEEVIEVIPEDEIVIKPKMPIYLTAFVNGNWLANDITSRGGDILFSDQLRSGANSILQEENAEYTLTHKRPISFGLLIGKQLSSRLSFETGLVFTQLDSEITSDSRFDIREKQRFVYLGVPFNINYTYHCLGKANLFLSGGVLFQKDVKGYYISNIGEPYSNRSLMPYSVKNYITQPNIQFSTHVKLGVSYPIYNKIFIFGEVGGAYYFDANNKYRTLYSDQQFEFTTSAGIKYNF